MENKELLLRDLCARLPYGVKIYHKSTDINGNISIYDMYILYEISSKGDCISLLNYDKKNGVCEVDITLGEFKPYLRPMSSMTKEEKKEYDLKYDLGYAEAYNEEVFCATSMIDFFNAHHLDYRGLIPKGLALEAPEGLYKFD